ncbi:hypothetical protein D3C77_494640 [compost metagenome]
MLVMAMKVMSRFMAKYQQEECHIGEGLDGISHHCLGQLDTCRWAGSFASWTISYCLDTQFKTVSCLKGVFDIGFERLNYILPRQG